MSEARSRRTSGGTSPSAGRKTPPRGVNRGSGTVSKSHTPPAGRGAGKGQNTRSEAKKGGKAAGGRRKKRPLSARLSRVSARTVILAILFIVFIAFAVGPVSRNIDATSRLREKEAELENQRSITESLEKEVEEARSFDYVEGEARRQRMVAPGEILYIITSEEEEQEVEYRVKKLQSMDEAWERVRQMLNCTHRRTPGGETEEE